MAILSPDTLDYVKARVPVFNPWADHLPESDRSGQIPVFSRSPWVLEKARSFVRNS
jgi:hypothetical protein